LRAQWRFSEVPAARAASRPRGGWCGRRAIATAGAVERGGYNRDGPPPAAGDVRCGYPDMAVLRDGRLGCVLAPSADADGIIDLRWLELIDRT